MVLDAIASSQPHVGQLRHRFKLIVFGVWCAWAGVGYYAVPRGDAKLRIPIGLIRRAPTFPWRREARYSHREWIVGVVHIDEAAGLVSPQRYDIRRRRGCLRQGDLYTQIQLGNGQCQGAL
ncbi:hypothetical protein D3C86_1539450 [compost metagenome]